VITVPGVGRTVLDAKNAASLQALEAIVSPVVLLFNTFDIENLECIVPTNAVPRKGPRL